ncbi:MAG: pyridoxamine 5'-phosphate oxidase family protein [Burkholderiales bacterium]|nr:pyridoxamine 5'-phosphate oxidase family protein [Burkholderiales bacterium]
MGKTYAAITPELGAWLTRQPVFFVATAPLSRDGHVNCSPKGLDTFRVLGPTTVAYADLTGSGAETAAHLEENGRIVLMFCAFSGPPRIVRLHGRGEAIVRSSAEWTEASAGFPSHPGTRAIIRVHVTRVSDSCGYSVPNMDLVGERDTLQRWVQTKGAANLPAYRREKNARSIDGLPGPGFDE